MWRVLAIVLILLCYPMSLTWAQTTPLPTPTHFTAVTINGVTTLSWDAMTGGNGYLLRVHLVGSPYDPCSVMAYCGGLDPRTSISLTLPPGVYDTWVHTAISDTVYSVSQGMMFTVPLPTTPALTYPKYGKPVTLSWNANTETDLAGYKVYRSLKSCALSVDNDYAVLATLGKVVTYMDAAIPLNTMSVCYRLTAYDTSSNESKLSNTAGKAVQVAPGAPTKPSFK